MKSMAFGDVIKRNMKLSAVFSGERGRTRRREFLYVALFCFFCVAVIACLSVVLYRHFGGNGDSWTFCSVLISSYFLYALVSCMTRRIHDTGNAAWPLNLSLNLLIIFIPLWLFKFYMTQDSFRICVAVVAGMSSLFFIYALILCFRDSEKATNRFGPSEKYPTVQSET